MKFPKAYQEIEMKKINTTKMARVEIPAEYRENDGVVAFQMVRFEINFFGNIQVTEHDTKIFEDGRQVVIGGDGFIPEGYEVN